MPADEQPPSPTLAILADASLDAEERAARLLPLVYEQLRAAAHRQLRAERAGHTLEATALVHEAFLKLCGPRDLPWRSRAHFVAAAAEAMRRILVDHARAKATLRRGGAEARAAAIDLRGLPDPASDRDAAGLLELDEALTRLQGVDAEAAEVVRLRYFAGLSVDDTAAAMGVSAPTVKRTWAFARGWLREALASGRDSGDS